MHEIYYEFTNEQRHTFSPGKKRTTDDKQQQYRKDTHQKLKWKKWTEFRWWAENNETQK